MQVQGAVFQFSSNFQVALNPQITKSYASGQWDYMHSLIFRSSKFTYLLLFVVSLPVFLKVDYILALWLKEVPPYSAIFLRLILCVTIVDAVANPFMTAAAATGKVKKYQTLVGSILLSILPISYVVLKLGGQPYSVFIVHLCVALIAFVVRLLVVRPLIRLSVGAYLRQVLLPLFAFSLVGVILPACYSWYSDNSFLSLVLVVLLSGVSTLLFGYLLALSKSERIFVRNKVQTLFLRR